MIWLKIGAEVLSWSSWLWQHREALEPALGKLGDLAQAAIGNPNGAVRRVGNAIVLNQPDAGDKIVAFIEQTGPQLDAIQSAVGGLQAGQQTLLSSLASVQGSLASLQTLSMVTLGLTALTPIVLLAQFNALNRRFADLHKQLARLSARVDAQIVGKLRAGLELLEQGCDLLDKGKENLARERLTQALAFSTESKKVFDKLLDNELNESKRRSVDRQELQLLARHLSVAVAAVAGCQIGLGEDHHAFAQSEEELKRVQEAARWIFRDTFGEPARYLIPGMREHGVTITLLCELFLQARDAGAIDKCPNSPSEWFEEYRSHIFATRQPFLFARRKCLAMKSRLCEAIAAIEEAGRLVALAKLVQQVRDRNQRMRDVMAQVKNEICNQGADDGSYVAWTLP